MKKNFYFILILLIIISISYSVYAQPPFVEQQLTTTENLQIFFPKGIYQKVNTDFYLNIHVFNGTGHILDNTTTECIVHLYNPRNEHIIRGSMDYFDKDFYFLVNKSLVPERGTYAYNVWCFDSVSQKGGGESAEFFLTNTGYEKTEFSLIPAIMFGIFIILVLISIAIISIWFYIKEDDK